MRKPPEIEDLWILTMSDLTTLLLCFFVFVLSVSSLGPGKGILKEALQSVIKSLGFKIKEKPMEELIVGALAESIELTTEERINLLKAVRGLLDIKEKTGQIEIGVTDLGLVVKAKNPVLFDIASAKLKPDAKPILDAILEIYKAKECNISIYGHTCNLPIHTPLYPSNWELSCSRAMSVLYYFQEKGVKGERLSATGCADTYPVAPNDSEANRRLNRRVEIFLDFRTKEL